MSNREIFFLISLLDGTADEDDDESQEGELLGDDAGDSDVKEEA